MQVFGADPAFADHLAPVIRRADDLFEFGVLPAKDQFNDVFLAVVKEADDVRRYGFFFGIEMIGGDVRAAAFATAASRWSSAFFVSIETTVAFSESKAFHSVDAS